MKIESRDTLGGYRIELCSQNKEEEEFLKKFEKEWSRKDIEKVNKLKDKR